MTAVAKGIERAALAWSWCEKLYDYTYSLGECQRGTWQHGCDRSTNAIFISSLIGSMFSNLFPTYFSYYPQTLLAYSDAMRIAGQVQNGQIPSNQKYALCLKRVFERYMSHQLQSKSTLLCGSALLYKVTRLAQKIYQWQHKWQQERAERELFKWYGGVEIPVEQAACDEQLSKMTQSLFTRLRGWNKVREETRATFKQKLKDQCVDLFSADLRPFLVAETTVKGQTVWTDVSCCDKSGPTTVCCPLTALKYYCENRKNLNRTEITPTNLQNLKRQFRDITSKAAWDRKVQYLQQAWEKHLDVIQRGGS